MNFPKFLLSSLLVFSHVAMPIKLDIAFVLDDGNEHTTINDTVYLDHNNRHVCTYPTLNLAIDAVCSDEHGAEIQAEVISKDCEGQLENVVCKPVIMALWNTPATFNLVEKDKFGHVNGHCSLTVVASKE